MAEKQTVLVKFEVVADKLWHSTECRFYVKGDTIEMPADIKITPESSVQPIKKAKAVDKDLA
jgi:hypothetical protein